MEKIIQALNEAILTNGLLQVETSARHVHLSQSDLEQLFGKGHELTPKRALSQPGQFLSEEKVIVVGPKGEKKVSVLGPVRKRTQVELSSSDCMSLGLTAPVRLSGALDNSGKVILKGPNGAVALSEGTIIAKAHIHLTPKVAEKLNVTDKQKVKVEVFTERPIQLMDVIVRVDEASSCKVHIDTDEANAAGCEGFTLGRILK